LDIKPSQRANSIKPSPTLAVTAKAGKLRAEGRDIIGLGAGEPDFDTPEHIKDAAIKALGEGFTKYTAVGGTPGLIQAIIKKFKKENRLKYSADQILVSCGCKHSLYNLMQALLNPGDEVIIPAPYWVSYPDMAKLAGAETVIIKTNAESNLKITPEQLQAAITNKTKLLILNSPSNPTGVCYTPDELAALGKVLINHPDIIIATDDIYEHILWGQDSFQNIVNVCPELYDRTVVLNGVSKAYSMTGFRCGYAGGPKEIIAKMSNMQSQSTAGVNAVGQAAAVAALNGPQELLAERAANLQRRRDILFEKLNAAEGLSCDLPDGAMYIFCSCAGTIGKRAPDGRVIETDTDFTMYLLDAVGVAVVQGEAYGLSPYFRASFVAPEADLIRGGDLIQQACAALT